MYKAVFKMNLSPNTYIHAGSVMVKYKGYICIDLWFNTFSYHHWQFTVLVSCITSMCIINMIFWPETFKLENVYRFSHILAIRNIYSTMKRHT